MAYFDCIVGGSGKGNTLVVTCADDLAGATITCTNGTKTYTKTCPSTAPYEVTFYGLMAGTWTVSATVSGDTYTTTVVITDYEAELGGFNWKTWVDLSENYTSSDFTDLDDLLSDETAVRELMTIHACVDYLADIATTSTDVETIIGNDLCAKWINNRDYALDTLYTNEIIAGYMDTADKYGYGEWTLMPQVPKMTSNTAPYGEVIESGHYSTFYAYLAFDGDTSNQGWTDTNKTDYYLGYHFISPVAITECHFQTFMGDDYHQANTNTLQASNTGNSDDWTDLGSVEAPTKGTYKIKTANTTAYSYYRLKLTRNRSDSNAVILNMLQFHAYAPKGNVPVMTSNTAPYGVASASSALGSGYNAFDAFKQEGNTAWLPASGTGFGSSWCEYKAANPICPKRVAIRSLSTNYTYNFKLQGSNDGLNYTDLATDLSAVCDNSWKYFDVETSNYYLYLRMVFVSSTNPDPTAGSGYMFQFYGRELSVSVPTMTGNTTPYGEASESSEMSGYPAWKAFDGTTSEAILNSTSGGWLSYMFNNPIYLKMVTAAHDNNNVRTPNAGAEIQVTKDGTTWSSAIYTFTNKLYPMQIANVDEEGCVGVRIANLSSSSQTSLTRVQFYGLDYSEKEFEEGTTKKWLYDHGVELETIESYWNSSGTSMEKKGSSIKAVISGGSNNYIGVGAILDLTSYNLARVRINEANGYPEMRIATTEGGYVAGVVTNANNLPNNVGLDISSISGQNRVCGLFFGNVTASAEMTELWLE